MAKLIRVSDDLYAAIVALKTHKRETMGDIIESLLPDEEEDEEDEDDE